MTIRPQLRELVPVSEIVCEQVAEAFPMSPFFQSSMLIEHPTLKAIETLLKETYRPADATIINETMKLVGVELGYIIPPVQQSKLNLTYTKRLAEQLAIAKATIAKRKLANSNPTTLKI